MKRIIQVILISLFVANTAFAASQYENNQFSINALVNSDNITNSMPVAMSLPVSDDFAPNVTVLVQQYPNSLTEYAELSIKQFKQINLKIIQNKQTKTNLVFEYSGTTQNRNLHSYAMAYKKGDKVFLITATSTESQWKTFSKILIECVKSFKLK